MDAAELDDAPIFSGLSAADRASLAEAMRGETHPRGAVLVEEGDLPTKFFVLLSGHATVHREGRHITDIGPGDFFGEVGVLSMEARNASVIATTPVRVATALGWDLRESLEAQPELRAVLVEAAGGRGGPA
jgi:CRP/FNR family transcriptional regulator, cyclic AMP receptor protein